MEETIYKGVSSKRGIQRNRFVTMKSSLVNNITIVLIVY